MIRSMRYALAALALPAAIVFGPATAAGAHGPAQQSPDASYYRTEITGGVTPAVAGVTASVDPGGEWVELSNTGSATVLVLGYGGEPYLRLTSTGVEENQLSQTTYINQTLFSDSVPTAQAATSVAPAWKQIATVGKIRWHDHRIHWMGQGRPPAVASDPTHPRLVGNWTVHATADGTPFEVRGVLRWLGKPADAGNASPAQAWLLTVLAGMTVVVGVLIIALIRARRRQPALSADGAPLADALSVTGPVPSSASSGSGSSGSVSSGSVSSES